MRRSRPRSAWRRRPTWSCARRARRRAAGTSRSTLPTPTSARWSARSSAPRSARRIRSTPPCTAPPRCAPPSRSRVRPGAGRAADAVGAERRGPGAVGRDLPRAAVRRGGHHAGPRERTGWRRHDAARPALRECGGPGQDVLTPFVQNGGRIIGRRRAQRADHQRRPGHAAGAERPDRRVRREHAGRPILRAAAGDLGRREGFRLRDAGRAARRRGRARQRRARDARWRGSAPCSWCPASHATSTRHGGSTAWWSASAG